MNTVYKKEKKQYTNDSWFVVTHTACKYACHTLMANTPFIQCTINLSVIV